MEWVRSVLGAIAGFILTGAYIWAIAAVAALLTWIAARALQERPACPVCGCNGMLPYVEFQRHGDRPSSFEGAKYGNGRQVFLNCERCNP